MSTPVNNNTKKYLAVIVALIVLSYLGYQVVRIAYKPVETEIAYEYTVEDTVETEAFVARQESYILNKKKGTIISVAGDGSRVAKGEEVAVVFSDTNAADNYSRLKDLEAQIERYKRLANQSDNYTFDINALDNNVDKAVINLVSIVDSGKLSELSNGVNNVRDQVVTRQIATGNVLDFETRLEELELEYDALSKASVAHSSIISNMSGYYISGTDGLEKIVDCSKVKEISVDDIYGIFKSKAEEVPKGAVGKIVTDFTWYFLCIVDSNRLGNLEVGDTITVNLPFSAVNTVKATVYAINENTGDEAAVILSCNLMNSNISSLRHETAELVIRSYTGLRVPASAIRVNEDGEKGVFVLNGNIVDFKKLNIVYSTDEFVLSAADVNDDSYVRLYDNIITGGKDLYDGKIVK